MKTLEARAVELMQNVSAGEDVPDYIRELLVGCYCVAATEERQLLTEWKNPALPPDCYKDVLIKVATQNGYKYVVGYYNGVAYYRSHDKYELYNVVCWREIHE